MATLQSHAPDICFGHFICAVRKPFIRHAFRQTRYAILIIALATLGVCGCIITPACSALSKHRFRRLWHMLTQYRALTHSHRADCHSF